MKRVPTRIIWVGAFLLGLMWSSYAHSAPPFDRTRHPGGPTCFVNKKAAQQNALRASSNGPSAQSLPVPLNPKVLVIRVGFSNLGITKTTLETQAFFASVRSYYTEVSYGVFIPTFTLSSIHTLSGTLASYGADCAGDIACHDATLRDDAIAAENLAGRDFTAFDQIMVYHAGDGQETSDDSNDIWSVYLPDDFTADAKLFHGFTLVPETEATVPQGPVVPLGVICHEYGHQLGLPDLYDTSVGGGQSSVGSWDLMDYPYTRQGSNPFGSNPPHFGAWSKVFLSFISPQSILAAGTTTQLSIETSSSLVRIPISAASSNEYFLVENRNISSAGTYDKGIESSGLLIWHIDDAIALNSTLLSNNIINAPGLSGQGHRGVDVVEADSTEVYPPGEPGDVFGNGDTFSAPLTNTFNDLDTGILLTGISGVGTSQIQYSYDLPGSHSVTTSDTVAVSTFLATTSGFIQFTVLPQTFPNGTAISFSEMSSTTLAGLGSNSAAAGLTATLDGIFLGATGLQPSQTISLTLGFAGDPVLASLPLPQMNLLTIARYDSTSHTWVPLASTVDTTALTVTANLNHLSIFQIMQVLPATQLSQTKIFPNPMRPSRGLSYAVMNFSNTPPEASIQIFSLTGELVQTLRANNVGFATWNGLNESGAKAASGVYLVMIQSPTGSERKVFKVAVER